MRLRSALLLAALTSCSATVRNDVQVMSYSPQGPVDRAEPIVIRFDKPVVPESEVSKSVDEDDVAVSPAFEWKGYWQDAQTLVIDPATKLVPSTRYEIGLTGSLGERTGKFGFNFVHQPLAVEGVWGVDAEMLVPDGDVPISFNQPVDPLAAAKHCKLTSPSGDVALVGTAGPAAANVSLKPERELDAGQAYNLGCTGLMAVGGNAALDKPYSLTVRARPPAGIRKVTPDGWDVPADEVTLTISFNTPVTLDAARSVVSSSPPIAGLDKGYLSSDGKDYKVTTDLEVETDYELTVDETLVDRFGQKLAGDFQHTFRTGAATPRISMERGIFALEASAKGYPMWTRNITSYDVECAMIPRDKIVQVLTTEMNYDPWGGNDDSDELDWKALKVTAKKSTHTTAGKNKWRLNELPLGTLCGGASDGRGVYLTEIHSKDVVPDRDRGWLSPRRNRVLANVTDMGVLIKVGSSSGLVWVTSLSTGKPVAGARVVIHKSSGEQVWVDISNADGIVKIPGSALLKAQQATPTGDDECEDCYEDWDSYRSQRLIATVEKDKDLAIVDGNWSNGIQLWNFGVTSDHSGGQTKIRGFIQSDRGLYRPGETVMFKGIAREITAGRAPRVPTAGKVEIQVEDSRGQTVLQTESKLSGFGGFGFELPLGEEASLGDYYVRASVADQVFREKFSVEEFRAASFELNLAAGKQKVKPGEKLSFALDAKYLMGSPVAAANVEWNLRKRDHSIAFKGYESYSFGTSRWGRYYYYDDYGEFISDGAGTTNQAGHITIAARDTATEFTGPVDYILSANVTDEADQTMGKTVVVTAHKSQFYLGMFANEWVQAVNMPFGVNLVALDPDGKRVATKAKLSVVRTVTSCDWQEIGARSYYHCSSAEHPLEERQVEIAAGGSHTERIFPTLPGDYTIKIEAKDAAGNEVSATNEIWVIGKGEAFWSGDEGARMTLIASKAKYEVGEKARLVAQANLVKPTALITIERDGIIDAKVKLLESANEGVEIPITDAYAPNVFASVAMVSGRHGAGDRNRPQFKMGVVELVVASEHKQLDVAVSLAQATVRPGDKVSGTIKVTHQGKPVKAEVSLSAADEGVLQLIAYQTPNPMKTFYASYGLGVDAATSWNRIARLADPESGDPDEGGDSGSEGDGQRVRSKFVASAYWAPMLVTNDKGEIPFSFTAPDNLTAFRLMAVAADIGDRFGAGETRLTINQPLMAAPALPRFMRIGDTASVGVVLHNHTDQAGSAVVSASANGAVLGSIRQVVQVPAKGSVRVRFPATASENAAVTFSFSAVMGNERDDVKVTIPIDRPRIVDQRLVAEKTLAAGETWKGNLAIGKDVLRKESQVIVTVDRSGVGDLAPSLRSLVEYPYGCLEQTMSRFLPLVAAKDLAKTLDDPSLQGTKANQFVRAGINKVVRHQQGDGHFSLWPQSETYPHLTAYALWGLTVAQQAGETVPDDTFTRGILALQQWGQQQERISPDGDGATLAMGAYVMALRKQPDAALNARLYQVRAGLPKWGQAFLLRAMILAKADAKQIAALKQALETTIVMTGDRGFVTEGMTREQYADHMSSDARATAMVLAALLEAGSDAKLTDALARGLKAARGKDATWESTQDNLWALVALAPYARRTAVDGDATLTISAGGVANKRVFKGSEVVSTSFLLSTMTTDDVTLSVDKGAAISVRTRELRVDAGEAQANGFAISRTYLDAAGNAKTSFKAGDMVTVKLVVTLKQHEKWIAMVDPLPAGFEAVNPKLAAGGVRTPDPNATWGNRYYNNYMWSHTEQRDDRVQWFADHLYADTFELTYQARATIDGTFSAMPATIEAMYDPTLRARTARTTVVVTR